MASQPVPTACMDQSQNRHSTILHGRIALHDKRPQWGIRQPMYSACKLTTGNTEDKHALFLILVLSTGLAHPTRICQSCATSSPPPTSLLHTTSSSTSYLFNHIDFAFFDQPLVSTHAPPTTRRPPHLAPRSALFDFILCDKI
ncbi:hypothetical protein LMH87_011633 [Akanthomyces muscarius]|uniref:Uncharacterized protein n=1 Tax=Akanthomyces muscarius TaxID=2231603 RepID=A0A9W8ULB4_AKAMU|nr:hypothetical protein LMH87_011633 [Akanthomyces muscarius]KAJ4150905.1 hypothetical protein LMH87_011633 [Akanthomyces muscarius]